MLGVLQGRITISALTASDDFRVGLTDKHDVQERAVLLVDHYERTDSTDGLVRVGTSTYVQLSIR